MMVSGLFKTKKPYLLLLLLLFIKPYVFVTYSAYSLIPMHSVYFLNDPVLTFLTFILSLF